MGFFSIWVAVCNEGRSHSISLKSSQDADTEDPDSDSIVDVLYDNLPMTGEDLVFCQLCAIHDSCEDNQIVGANLTLFEECTARQCCFDEYMDEDMDNHPVPSKLGSIFIPREAMTKALVALIVRPVICMACVLLILDMRFVQAKDAVMVMQILMKTTGSRLLSLMITTLPQLTNPM